MSERAYFFAQLWLIACVVIALVTHLRGKKGRSDCLVCNGDGYFETATGERFDCSCKGGE